MIVNICRAYDENENEWKIVGVYTMEIETSNITKWLEAQPWYDFYNDYEFQAFRVQGPNDFFGRMVDIDD